ncbi:MAG: NADPH-dependent FMN reductase [Gemmatimonadales bacterium]|nr:NADPH-dependent FMN reductase [Gemmatimonadales bacterium]
MSRPLSLVMLSGSLRTGSFNTALLRALQELAPDTLRLTMLEWRTVPVYDGDCEDREGIPAVVTELQAAIRASDGLVIATPEYNHSIPGGFKNLLDWLSRGPMPHGLHGVPTAILGASVGTIGTTRAQAILRQTLAALNAPTMPSPQVLVTDANNRFGADGSLTDQATRNFVGNWLVAVERWMRRFPLAER